jgi:hypothetical protein
VAAWLAPVKYRRIVRRFRVRLDRAGAVDELVVKVAKAAKLVLAVQAEAVKAQPVAVVAADKAVQPLERFDSIEPKSNEP